MVFDCKSFFISHWFVINLPTEAKVEEIIMDGLIPNCKLSKCGIVEPRKVKDIHLVTWLGLATKTSSGRFC